MNFGSHYTEVIIEGIHYLIPNPGRTSFRVLMSGTVCDDRCIAR